MEENEKKQSDIEEKTEEKKEYHPPRMESHNPLEIMSAWEDKSSELEF